MLANNEMNTYQVISTSTRRTRKTATINVDLPPYVAMRRPVWESLCTEWSAYVGALPRGKGRLVMGGGVNCFRLSVLRDDFAQWVERVKAILGTPSNLKVERGPYPRCAKPSLAEVSTWAKGVTQ